MFLRRRPEKPQDHMSSANFGCFVLLSFHHRMTGAHRTIDHHPDENADIHLSLGHGIQHQTSIELSELSELRDVHI